MITRVRGTRRLINYKISAIRMMIIEVISARRDKPVNVFRIDEITISYRYEINTYN